MCFKTDPSKNLFTVKTHVFLFLSANISLFQSYDFCVLCIVADVNNALKFQHETLIGFQVTEQIHNTKL